MTAWTGSIVPMVVVNATAAPTIGWPPLPSNSAVSTAAPLTETERVGVESANFESEGAVGVLEAQVLVRTARIATPATRARRIAAPWPTLIGI